MSQDFSHTLYHPPMPSGMFGKRHTVAGDRRIHPDTSLQGYQDDILTGNKEDVLQYEQGTSPQEVTGMKPTDLREQFNAIALDEQPSAGSATEVQESGTQDDWREMVEDMDEADRK